MTPLPVETSHPETDPAPNEPHRDEPVGAGPAAGPSGRPGKGALGFFAAVMSLYLAPGAAAQALSPPLGLAWTQLFIFLLPAWAAAAGSNLHPRPFLLLSRRPSAGQVVLGLLCGAAAFPLANGIMALSSALLPESWVRSFDLSGLFQGPPLQRAGIALAASLLAPFCEEVAFRGYLQGALLTRRRPAAAIALGALLFAVMHLDPVRFVALVGLGALYGWLAWRSGSIWPAVIAHAVNNTLGVTLASLGAASTTLPPTHPPPLQVAGAAALTLAVSGALLRAAATAFRRATPAPPPVEGALLRRDPEEPSTRFDLGRVPRPLLGLALAGTAVLLALLLSAPR